MLASAMMKSIARSLQDVSIQMHTDIKGLKSHKKDKQIMTNCLKQVKS